MNDAVREIPLDNGLTVRFTDTSHRYFGDYHQVRVEVCIEVPLAPQLFDDPAQYQGALKLLGPTVCYRKLIEHQGVPTLGTGESAQRTIQQFVDHSLSYFSSETFPRRFVQSELKRIAARSRSFVPRPHV